MHMSLIQLQQHQQYRLEDLAETQTTISHHDYEQQAGKPQRSDDLDASLEEQIKVIREWLFHLHLTWQETGTVDTSI